MYKTLDDVLTPIHGRDRQKDVVLPYAPVATERVAVIVNKNAKQVAKELFAAYRSSGFSGAVARKQRDGFWIARERGLLDRLTDALGHRPALLP